VLLRHAVFREQEKKPLLVPFGKHALAGEDSASAKVRLNQILTALKHLFAQDRRKNKAYQ
jgi:hypothetical protein